MKDKELIKALIDAKLITSDAADRLLGDVGSTKRSAEQLVYDRQLVAEEEVAKIKSQLLKIPYKKVDPDQLSPELLKLIPTDAANRYKIIPLEKKSDMLIVGAVNPEDASVKEALRFVGKDLKINLGVYLVTPKDVMAVLKQYGGANKDEVQAALRAIKPLSGQRGITMESEMAVAQEAPVIKIVSSILKDAVGADASDIHLEPQRNRLRVRFRKNGVLQEVLSLPIELHQPIISRVKILSNLKIDETRIPQDGRFRTNILDRDIDFRVSSFPTPFGEKLALRVLDPKVGLRSLDDLGFLNRNADLLKEAIAKPYGMVLITGPTGSGKTTTLYSLMQILNNDGVNIVSLEDPVEYSIEGVNQSQIKPEIGYDFASGLREILRQDPDVIMVGEIRDSETATLAVHAALTGHIVLTTLHTNNAVTAVPRLIDLGIQPFLLPSSLNLMGAQRLVSELCPDCKKSTVASQAMTEIINKELSEMPESIRSKYKAPYKIYHAGGCATCNQKGIVGRLAVFEAFKMTPQLSDIISSGVTENKLWDESKRQGMVTLRQDGILKSLDGRVSMEEVLRDTEEA
ncbi:MAG: GspE/PulE family protein [bacterium]|nr:GspE/PulE family protein [bacterium]